MSTILNGHLRKTNPKEGPLHRPAGLPGLLHLSRDGKHLLQEVPGPSQPIEGPAMHWQQDERLARLSLEDRSSRLLGVKNERVPLLNTLHPPSLVMLRRAGFHLSAKR